MCASEVQLPKLVREPTWIARSGLFMIEVEVDEDAERRNNCQHAAVISRARDLHTTISPKMYPVLGRYGYQR